MSLLLLTAAVSWGQSSRKICILELMYHWIYGIFKYHIEKFLNFFFFEKSLAGIEMQELLQSVGCS